MDKWKKKLIGFIATIICLPVIAQNANTTSETNSDLMKTGGHIYVVLAIVITILAGLIIYIIRLDKKITKLENNDL